MRPTRESDETGRFVSLTAFAEREFLPYLVLLRRGFAVHPHVAMRYGGLLPHLFTLTPRVLEAVYFLWHFPSGFPASDAKNDIGACCHVEFGLSSLPQKRESGCLTHFAKSFSI